MPQSARESTTNNPTWFEVQNTPLSAVGIFPYLGRSISPDLEPDRFYNVYRPAEELARPECVQSFRLLPWVDDHTMLGSSDVGRTPAEQIGVHGVIGENVWFDEACGWLKGNIKAFSEAMAGLIQFGKKQLSCGYDCRYEARPGIWNGQPYEFIQRDIRGNHLALVKEGRMGPQSAVMDSLTFSFDATEAKKMEPEMTIAELTAAIKSLMPVVQQVSDMQAMLAGLTKPAAPAAVDTPAGDTPAGVAAPVVVEDTEAVVPPVAMDAAALTKAAMLQIAARDRLANDISKHVGTFDHAEMTLADVVKYGCDKLEIKPAAGAEHAMLTGYLLGKQTATPAATVAVDALPRSSFVDAMTAPNV